VVENCFLRTLDDLIVIKTNPGKGGAGRIIAEKCVLWNEVAHALSIGAEIRENIDDVLFADCDVIGDHGREWTLRIYQCDNTVVSNVRFENIRIEETIKLANLCIIENIYTTTPGGHIRNVVFKDIVVTNTSGTMTDRFNFVGYDAGHAINGVLLQNVTIEGRKATAADVVTNGFAYDLKFE
jgi:polygalacturonase